MKSKTESSSFFKFTLFICLLLPVVSLSESVSNSGLQGSNNEDVPFGLEQGRNVDIKHAKYVASLLYRPLNPPLLGTVTIVNKHWVLSSAFNVNGYSTQELQVRVGSNHFDKDGIVYGVSKKIIHPSYTTNFVNNIALLKLDSPIEFSRVAGKIDIPQYKIKYNGLRAKVYGFGWDNTHLVGRLQEATVPLIDYTTCENMFQETTPLSNLNFCSARGGGGPCGLDTGSPVVQNKKLIGIFTVSYGCGSTKDPNVYIDVTRYRKWIWSTIKSN